IGLGRFGPKPKTPGRFQTYLLFTMYSEQASILANDANVFSSKGYSSTHAPKALREGAKLLATRYRAVLLADQITHAGSASRRPSLAGPCEAQRQSRDSVST
ncbi:hypothetical protein EXN51_27945, partial [Agrobacterium fabrum]